MTRRLRRTRWLVGFSLRRLHADRRLMVVLVVGAFLAVGFAAAVAIYLGAIRDLGFRSLVEDAAPERLALRYVREGVTTSSENVAGLEQTLDAEVARAAQDL